MTSSTKPARLASTAAAAAEHDISVWTVRRWIKVGMLTRYQLGPRVLRVDLDELDALVQKGGRS